MSINEGSNECHCFTMGTVNLACPMHGEVVQAVVSNEEVMKAARKVMEKYAGTFQALAEHERMERGPAPITNHRPSKDLMEAENRMWRAVRNVPLNIDAGVRLDLDAHKAMAQQFFFQARECYKETGQEGKHLLDGLEHVERIEQINNALNASPIGDEYEIDWGMLAGHLKTEIDSVSTDFDFSQVTSHSPEMLELYNKIYAFSKRVHYVRLAQKIALGVFRKRGEE